MKKSLARQLFHGLLYLMIGSLCGFFIFAKVEVTKLSRQLTRMEADNKRLMGQLDSARRVPRLLLVMGDSVFPMEVDTSKIRP